MTRPARIVFFGAPIACSRSSYTTMCRALTKSLHAMGHQITSYERRDPTLDAAGDPSLPTYCELVLYDDFSSVRERATADVARADAAIVTSSCADAIAASEIVSASSGPVRAFYDFHAPVTLARLEAEDIPSYVGPRGYRDFDVVLSLAGGSTLAALERLLGAKTTKLLVPCVDPDTHFPAHLPFWTNDLSFVGNHAPTRQAALDALFIEVARREPERKMLLAGEGYPTDVAMPPNVVHLHHVSIDDHSAFYGSSTFTLNVTLPAMARYGFCPSVRLFEAAAAGAPILTDRWDGLERFFEPGVELLVVESADEVIEMLRVPSNERTRIAAAARRRALAHHTSTTRARELLRHLNIDAIEAGLRTFDYA